MSNQAEILKPERQVTAEALVDSLPDPRYELNYQVAYPDRGLLVGAMAENLTIQGVTTPRQAGSLTGELEAVSARDSDRVMVITGSCRETIHAGVPVSRLAETSQTNLSIIAGSSLRNVVAIQRDRGQYNKPRSSGREIDPEGNTILSYMGDVVNGEDFGDRLPDPERLVAGSRQARDLEIELGQKMGRHVPAAHEALCLPYELPFVRQDAETGDYYSESADILWAGLRTNQLDSEIIRLLQGIRNTVGVKIGADSDEDHIGGLSERLNPDNRPGKLIFMLRLGLHEADSYPTILDAINKHAGSAIVLFDIHGTTVKQPGGDKIRHVPSIIEGLGVMARACREAGVKLGGVHLETTPDAGRQECVEQLGELPLHPGDIDPRLNPSQTIRVLNALAAIQSERS